LCGEIEKTGIKGIVISLVPVFLPMALVQ